MNPVGLPRFDSRESILPPDMVFPRRAGGIGSRSVTCSSIPSIPEEDEMSDPGRTVVDNIYSTLRIDAQWSVREERGFTWWAKDFAQRVWAEPPFVEEGLAVSRLHARADVVRGFSASRETVTMLASYNKLASVKGFVWDSQQPDRVALAASMYAHDQNLAMVQRLFSFGVAMQAAHAQSKARTLAFILGAECGVSPHPSAGFRKRADDTLDLVERVVLPEGLQESRWPGKELEQAVSLFSDPPACCARVTKTGWRRNSRPPGRQRS